MAQGAIDVNRMIGRLLIVDGRNDSESEEYFDMVNAIFRVWKAKEYLNEEGDIEELFCDYTNDELYSQICISEGNKMSIIDGPVKFKDGTVFDEPQGGWVLSNFLEMIENYELMRRLKKVNYFLGGIDNKNVLFDGIEKVGDYFVINWGS